MQDEIEELQSLIMQSSADIRKTETEKNDTNIPSQKDLKDYSSKLQNELLKSDQNVKVHKAITSIRTPSKDIKKLPITLSKKNSQVSFNKPIVGHHEIPKVPGSTAKEKITIPSKLVDRESPGKDSKIVKLTMRKSESQSKAIRIRRASNSSRTNLNEMIN